MRNLLPARRLAASIDAPAQRFIAVRRRSVSALRHTDRMSFLAIDIGNTRLKWAQYASPQPGAVLLAQGAVFLETIDTLAETEWQALPPPASMLGCVVAGEGVKRRVEEQLEIWDLEPRWVVSSRAGLRRRATATTTRTGSAWTAGSR